MPTAPSRWLISPFVAGILAAATFLSACSSEPTSTSTAPELAWGGPGCAPLSRWVGCRRLEAWAHERDQG